MLTDRRRKILRLVAHTYIATARPVPSARIAARLSISSATVRNEFAALEEHGMLLQRHVSAGRIPSSLGLDVYARSFIPPGNLSARQRLLIHSRLNDAHGDHLLQRIAQLTADLSGYAVAVRLPPDNSLRALRIHLTALSSEQLLAVVILENGLVRQQTLEARPVPQESVLDEVEASLNRLIVPLGQLRRASLGLAASSDGELKRMYRLLAEAASQLNQARVFQHGVSNLLEEPEAQDPEFLRHAVREVESSYAGATPASDLDLVLAESTARVRAVLPLGRLRAELNVIGPVRMRYGETFRIASGITAALRHGEAQDLS